MISYHEINTKYQILQFAQLNFTARHMTELKHTDPTAFNVLQTKYWEIKTKTHNPQHSFGSYGLTHKEFNVCIFISICICVFLSICICVFLSICVCVFLSICVCVFLSICIFICITIYRMF